MADVHDPDQGNVDGKGQPPGSSQATTDDETRRVVGGLLAAGGVGLLVLTIFSLRDKWPHSVESILPFAALIPVSLSIVILFHLINPRSPGSWTSDLAAWFSRIARSIWVLIAVALVLVGAATFWVATDRSDEPKVFDSFVMQLPAEVAKADADATSQANGDTVKAPKAVGMLSDPGFIMWTAERKGHEPPTGALPTFLGAVLIIAFGLWFPHIRTEQAETAWPQITKLVAPIMSLGLLGVGVSQSNTAEKIKADEKLTKQGLPSYISVPVAQRNTVRERIYERVYLQDPATISPEALADLRMKLATLQTLVEKDAAAQVADRDADKTLTLLTEKLAKIDQTIGSRPTATPLTDAQVEKIAEALTRAPIITEIKLKDSNEQCEQVMLKLAELGEPLDPGPESPDKAEGATSGEATTQKTGNAFERSWYWFKGKPSPYQQSIQSAEQANKIAALRRQQQVACKV